MLLAYRPLKALCHYNYKAYLLLDELVSSKNQLKLAQEVWARPISWHSPRKYAGICGQTRAAQIKTFGTSTICNCRVENPANFCYEHPEE